MDLIVLILVLAVLGFVVWIVTTQIPMPDVFKWVIYVIVAIALILFVTRQFSGSVPNVLR